jgi:hypothetical protein
MFFTNLPRPKKAAAMLGKDGSVTKMQLWRNIKRICNLFQVQEVTIQSRVGDPEIAFGL